MNTGTRQRLRRELTVRTDCRPQTCTRSGGYARATLIYMSATIPARRFVVYQVQLGRDEMDHLTELATEGIPYPHVQLETERNGRRFRATDLDSLLQSVRKLCGPQCSTKWTRLTWHASGLERAASLRFQDDCLTVEFRTADADWAAERERDVAYYLRHEAGARDQPLSLATLRWIFPPALVMLCVFLWAELGLWSLIRESSRNRPVDMGLSILLVSFLFGGYTFYRRLCTVSRRECRTEVDVQHPRPPQLPFLRLLVPDWASAIVASLVAAVATLAAVLALIATGLQAAH